MAEYTKETLVEMFTFLDGIRSSGKVNMFGAAPHLTTMFHLSAKESTKVLADWMYTFSDETPAERVAKFKR